MKKLLTVVMVIALTVAFASSDQDPVSDEMSKFLGRGLQDIETVGIYILTLNHTDLPLSESEIRDRVHVAFMRGGVDFREMEEVEFTQFEPSAGEVHLRIAVEAQEILGRSIYDVMVRGSVSEDVYLKRDLSIRLLLETYDQDSGGFCTSGSFETAVYKHVSKIAEDFVRSYKLNNPARVD